MSILGLMDIRFLTDSGNTMDNCEDCCTGGETGYCDHDIYMWFQNKLGQTCHTRWLFNNWRWAKGNDGKNEDDAFDVGGEWKLFQWYQTNCIKEWGFYVPNKVMSVPNIIACMLLKLIIPVYVCMSY